MLWGDSMNKDYLRVFRAFSDERRLHVLELLSQGEQCACVLLQELDISQPTLSYHMKILCQSGIVKERPVGPWKYYSIDGEGCEYAQKLLQALRESGDSVGIFLVRLIAELGRAVGSESADNGLAEVPQKECIAACCCHNHG